MAMIPILLVLVLVAVLAVVVAGAGTAGDAQHLLGPGATPQERDVAARYLHRHRTHRAVGGAVGVLVAVVVGARVQQNVTIGIGGGSPFGDLLFCGFAGVVIGALSAETYRLRAVPGPAAASLAPRAEVAADGVVRLARVCGATALLVGVLALGLGAGTAPLLVAVAGVAVVAIAEATLRAVRDRRRPVLSARGQLVDERLRAFAGRAVSHLEGAAGVLGLGWVVSALPSPHLVVGVVQVVVALAALVAAVVLMRRASPRPRAVREPALA